MYDKIVEQYDWVAVRTCVSCKTEIVIKEEDLVYKRNKLAFFKKECYTYCKNKVHSSKRVKIHISKKFIPKYILDKIPVDSHTNSKYSNCYSKKELKQFKQEVCCKNCKNVNSVSYKDLKLKRETELNPLWWIGCIEVFITCEQCGAQNNLKNSDFKLYINQKINRYDKINWRQNIKTVLKNTPLGLTVYVILIPIVGVLIGVLSLSVLAIPILMTLNYTDSKDRVVDKVV